MPDRALPLHGWTVVSLRPRGQHAAVRTAAARLGARALACSPFAITSCMDDACRRSLANAAACEVVVVTSPNAVAAAQALQPLHPRRGQRWLAVGAGSRDALARIGIVAEAPARMDSEGLLAMPALQDVRGMRVGFITAPGGRGRIAAVLRGRGARLKRADVYQRQPVAIPPVAWQRLRDALADPARVLVLASSGEALLGMLGQAGPWVEQALTRAAAAVPGERLAGIAREAGFTRVAIAGSPRPAAMLRAAAEAFA